MSFHMHPDMKLGEVKLKVSQLQRSVQFYEEVVGFRVLRQDSDTAELTADGRTVLVVLEQIPNAVVVPRRSRSGLYHFAILLPTRKDLGLSLRRITEKGIHVGQGDHLVSEALYISDPDHNGIEIYRDRPREEWTYGDNGEVAMTTDPVDVEGLLKVSENAVWTGLPVGTTIGHVHLHVSSLQTSKTFYTDRLGMDVMFDATRQMGAVFLSAGGYHHHLGMNIWAGERAPGRSANETGLDYFTIVLPGQDVLEQLLGHLDKSGVFAEERGGEWFIADPSGIAVKLTY